jgi:opacity protein-like surface antigen
MKKRMIFFEALVFCLAIFASAQAETSMAKKTKSAQASETPQIASTTLPHWAGFYAGFRSGVLFGTSDYQTVYTYDPTSQVSGSILPFGGVAGEQIEYYLQEGFFVFGLYSTMNMGSASGEVNFTYPGQTELETFTSTMDWFGSTQARVGIAADKILFDMGIGLGYGGMHYSDGDTQLYEDTHYTTATGPAFGAGVAYAISQSMVLGLYYDLIPFDNVYKMVYFDDPANNYALRKMTIHSITFGTSFKF